MSYAHLLNRHIEKEDCVVYKYAPRSMGKETIDKLEHEYMIFEKNAAKENIQNKYLRLLEELEGE